MGSRLSWYAVEKCTQQRNSNLLCVIDIYSKDALVVLLKDEKGITITKVFKVQESRFKGQKSNKSNQKVGNFRIDQWNHC